MAQLFAIARFCIAQANDPKYRYGVSREYVADMLQRHPWLIEEYVLKGWLP